MRADIEDARRRVEARDPLAVVACLDALKAADELAAAVVALTAEIDSPGEAEG